jgi:hypothetical protein
MAGFFASAGAVLNWALFNCFVSKEDAATDAFLLPGDAGKSLSRKART